MRVPVGGLAERARRGDTEAFAQLVRTHQNAVFAIASAITLDSDSAEDLTQICFLEAFRRLGELRDGQRFTPWLHAIARNRARDWLRQQSRVRALSGDPSEPGSRWSQELPEDPQVAALATERNEAVKRTVYSLPREYREVVLLRYVGELNHAEIAEALGISVPAVKMRWHRARKILEQRLEEWAPEGLQRARDELPAS
jgi:RNA polymerase sigma-70 factor (ECF subfamily)